MGDLLAPLIVAGLVAFVVVLVLRRPIAAGWRALLGLNLRRVVFVTALLSVAWLGAFPPWSFTFSGPGASQVVRSGPPAFILSPPTPETTGIRNGVTVDVPRLLIEWIIVGAIAAALAGLLPRPRPRPRGTIFAETDDDGAEAGQSEIDGPGTHEPPVSPSGSAGPGGDDPDDAVAWSTHSRGKARTPLEGHMGFPRIDGAVRAAAIAPPPVTRSRSGGEMSNAEFKELADQLAEGMARTLRERTLADSQPDSAKAQPANESHSEAASPALGPAPRPWVVRRIKGMGMAERELDEADDVSDSITHLPKE